MQAVTPTFDHFTCARVRNPSWRVCTAECEIPEEEVVVACETIACNGNIVSCGGVADWFLYDYQCSRCEVKSIEVVSELFDDNQCIGSMIKSIADVKFCNTGGGHSPWLKGECVSDNCGQLCECEPIIRDGIPFRISNGWICEGSGYEELVNIFWGVNESPPQIETENGANLCASYHLVDYMDKLEDLTLNNDILLTDVTADEIMAAIFADVGLATSYTFETGAYTHPFWYGHKGDSVASALLCLVQSENGIFKQDPSTGVFQFISQETLDDTEPVALLTTDDCCEGCALITDITYPDLDPVINRVTVKWAEPGISDNVEIFNSPLKFYLANGQCRTETFNNAGAITAISNIDIEANSQADGQGTDISGGFTTTYTQVDANTVTIKYCNVSGSNGYITSTSIIGTEIITVDEGEVTLFNTFNDINDCDITRAKEIDNACVVSAQQATDLAQDILLRYSDFSNQEINVSVKAIPNLELGDKLNIRRRIDNCVPGEEQFCCDNQCHEGQFCEDCWVVVKIHTVLDGDCFRQNLRLRRCPADPECIVACTNSAVVCTQNFICC